MEAEIIRTNLFNTQVCVPKSWTDEQVVEFAERKNPCGTEHGWRIKKSGSDERVQCESRPGFVHTILEA